MQKEAVIGEILPLVNQLCQDDQDSVRLLTVEIVCTIADRFSAEEKKTHLLGIVKCLCADKSWRVRYMVAEKFVKASCRWFLKEECDFDE